jgi:hypothetical protein
MANKRDLKKELSQLYHLNGEIEQLQNQLNELKRAVFTTNAHKTSDSVKGSTIAFPYILHSVMVEGLTKKDLNTKMRLNSEIADIIKLIEINKAK